MGCSYVNSGRQALMQRFPDLGYTAKRREASNNLMRRRVSKGIAWNNSQLARDYEAHVESVVSLDSKFI
jgi:hypothetical protein